MRDEKKLFARQMEVFAGFGEYADAEIGRLIQAIEDMGQLDNTLFFYIVGDNGASAEGGMNGMFNEMTYFNGVPETVADSPEALSTSLAARIRTATTRPDGRSRVIRPSPGRSRSPAATAATRNGLVIHWPKGFKAKGELRSQWHHVIDIAPTVLEAAGLPEPKSGERDAAEADRGREHALLLRNAKAKDPHDAVLRDLRQPRHLPRRLAGPHRSSRRLGIQAASALLEDTWELYHAM